MTEEKDVTQQDDEWNPPSEERLEKMLTDVSNDTWVDSQVGALEVYKEALRTAWEDGVITEEEFALLKLIRNNLAKSISQKARPVKAADYQKETADVPTNIAAMDDAAAGGNKVYVDALKQAWDDGVVSKDELAILTKLGEALRSDHSFDEIYDQLVEVALADGVITDEEQELLDSIKAQLDGKKE